MTYEPVENAKGFRESSKAVFVCSYAIPLTSPYLISILKSN